MTEKSSSHSDCATSRIVGVRSDEVSGCGGCERSMATDLCEKRMATKKNDVEGTSETMRCPVPSREKNEREGTSRGNQKPEEESHR